MNTNTEEFACELHNIELFSSLCNLIGDIISIYSGCCRLLWVLAVCVGRTFGRPGGIGGRLARYHSHSHIVFIWMEWKWLSLS